MCRGVALNYNAGPLETQVGKGAVSLNLTLRRSVLISRSMASCVVIYTVSGSECSTYMLMCAHVCHWRVIELVMKVSTWLPFERTQKVNTVE